MTDLMLERLMEAGWEEFPKIESSYRFLGGDALEKLLSDYTFNSVLDIGCGEGFATEEFIKNNKTVKSIDVNTEASGINADYLDYDCGMEFDCIWCCHVLEHVKEVTPFLKKIHGDLKQDGILCITVPPLCHNIIDGHLSLWNMGTLLYNLVTVGFNCKNAIGKMYDYNISVIVRKEPRKTNSLKYEDIMNDMPCNITDGRIKEIKWYD